MSHKNVYERVYEKRHSKTDTFFRRKNRLKIVSVFCDIFVTEFVTCFLQREVCGVTERKTCVTRERVSERRRRRSYGVTELVTE